MHLVRGAATAGGVARSAACKSQSAIDLPAKALVWEDENGKVSIAINTGEYVEQRHGIKGGGTS